MGFVVRGLGLIACISLISGCFQVETTVRVNPDGSGTIEERMLLSRKVVSQFDELARAFAGPEEKPKPFTLHEQEKLRKRAADLGPDVVFVRSSQVDTEAYTGYKALYSFSDINKVRLSSDGSDTMVGQGQKKSESAEKPLEFRFTRGPESRLVIVFPRNGKAAQASDPKGDDREEPLSMSPEQKKEFAELMKGMRFSLVVEMNGKIVKTNATHRDGNRITLFDFDLDRMGGGVEQLQKLQPAGGSQAPTFAEARAMLKQIPGVSVDLNDQVEVLFTR